jgi:predicted nicotinamide N-methyase
MNRDQIVQALMFYASNAKWEFITETSSMNSQGLLTVTKISSEDTGYDHIVWNDVFYDKPTEEQLEKLYQDSVEAYSSETFYKPLRQQAYPSIEEQLDMIFHQGVDVWKEKIQAIKDSIPKSASTATTSTIEVSIFRQIPEDYTPPTGE